MFLKTKSILIMKWSMRWFHDKILILILMKCVLSNFNLNCFDRFDFLIVIDLSIWNVVLKFWNCFDRFDFLIVIDLSIWNVVLKFWNVVFWFFETNVVIKFWNVVTKSNFEIVFCDIMINWWIVFDNVKLKSMTTIRW